MKSETKNPVVLISGAGQLGSRYLQGLSKCRMPLQIYIQDISQKSLEQAQQRWNEVNGYETHHVVSFLTQIEQCPQQLDIAIVASTANCRPQIVKEIAHQANVRHWILEKVLAQNTQALDELLLNVGRDALAWVNTPRRIIPWHQMIKERLESKSPLHMNITGGAWGLACNAVHFLDLLAWWSGESLIKISTEQLECAWFEGKRAGNWEVFGTLEAKFSGGSTAKMSAGVGEVVYSVELIDSERTWCIDEENGTASCSDGTEVPGRVPFQSEMTTSLIEEIIETGYCQLPSLEASIEIHRVFIDAMLEHWKHNADASATFIPIT